MRNAYGEPTLTQLSKQKNHAKALQNLIKQKTHNATYRKDGGVKPAQAKQTYTHGG